MTDVNFLKGLNYPDFVGYINQWNVLPGAYNTLSKWAVFSQLNKSSSLLQIGCTTGFQSRELVHLTGCKAFGVDLSEYAITSAKENAARYSPQANIKYKVANAEKHEFEDKYTHIAMGAGLKFFKNPDYMIQRCTSLLVDNGYILASPFFVDKEVPESVIQNSKEVFGIMPTIEPYKMIMSPYTKFEILFEERNSIEKETDEEIEIYCRNTIDRFSQDKGIHESQTLDYAYDRLRVVRKATNDLRGYQKYSVLVLRYREKVYPNRFVELF